VRRLPHGRHEPALSLDPDGHVALTSRSPDGEGRAVLLQFLFRVQSTGGKWSQLDYAKRCPVCRTFFLARSRSGKYCSTACERAVGAGRDRQRRARRAAEMQALGLDAPPNQCVDRRILTPEGLRARVAALERQGLRPPVAMTVADAEVSRLGTRVKPV
jgi:hypothetical protein